MASRSGGAARRIQEWFRGYKYCREGRNAGPNDSARYDEVFSHGIFDPGDGKMSTAPPNSEDPALTTAGASGRSQGIFGQGGRN
eukprot:399072-Rhodomonas_salina.1